MIEELPQSGLDVGAVIVPLFVVVSGLPASGKSTVAACLAEDLRLPLLDKDAYLEALFRDAVDGSPQLRELLSRRADEMLTTAAQRTEGAVLSSWWKHPQSNTDTGTPISWLRSLPGMLIEVHCICRPELAAARFLARKRHPGHCDERHSEAMLVRAFTEQATLGPLGVGGLVEVDSESPFNRGIVARRIKSLLTSSGDQL
jgi:hypothetical protein